MPRRFWQFLPAVLAIPAAAFLASKADEWSPGFIFGGLAGTALILVALANALAHAAGAGGGSSHWLTFVSSPETSSGRIRRLESVVSDLQTQVQELGTSSERGLAVWEGLRADLTTVRSEVEDQAVFAREAAWAARAPDLALELSTVREALESQQVELRELLQDVVTRTRRDIEGLRHAVARVQSRTELIAAPATTPIDFFELARFRERGLTGVPAYQFTGYLTALAYFIQKSTHGETEELAVEALRRLQEESFIEPVFRTSRWDVWSSEMHTKFAVDLELAREDIEIVFTRDPSGKPTVHVSRKGAGLLGPGETRRGGG